MRVYIDGVGLYGPGLDSWDEGRLILSGQRPYERRNMPPAPASALSPNERRRCGTTVRLAIQVAEEASIRAGIDATVPSVFASSGGDSEILHNLCETLATTPKDLSPTRFHNSVHNAPVGYWSIAHKATASSTSLSCFDGTFAGGLIEAAVSVLTETGKTLLVVYDLPAPEPLHSACPFICGFGVAFVLARKAGGRSIAALDIELTGDTGNIAVMGNSDLETIRTGNPAARSLTLLEALALDRTAGLKIPYLDDLAVYLTVEPIVHRAQ
ncbi:MAG: beta-ketoacyl synthase chain length factor [Nitrospinae bacterium]|nr:beta-ketoacyl synthase chain length factor [Nitrospinota bacterium]MBF0633832.1 beta-ketoacyl synthase chain length factor [Nitrospinota bacterium]